MNKNINETEWKEFMIKETKAFDHLLCISNCSGFEYCNLVKFNKLSKSCGYYYVDLKNQSTQLIDSEGVILYFYPTKYQFQINIDRAFEERNYLLPK